MIADLGGNCPLCEIFRVDGASSRVMIADAWDREFSGFPADLAVVTEDGTGNRYLQVLRGLLS